MKDGGNLTGRGIPRGVQGVKGQEQVKRNVEMAALGGRNILMIGPPDAGKTIVITIYCKRLITKRMIISNKL
jgi:predicted ATPase with chaperone activity